MIGGADDATAVAIASIPGVISIEPAERDADSAATSSGSLRAPPPPCRPRSPGSPPTTARPSPRTTSSASGWKTSSSASSTRRSVRHDRLDLICHARAAGRASRPDRFPGFGPLFRKDRSEWAHSRASGSSSRSPPLFMTLTAANAAINTYVRTHFPDAKLAGIPMPSLDPATNLVAALATQIFVIAAIFAVASLIVVERETGTLAWVASKPVSRRSIWLSKWISSTAILAIAAALVPLIVTTGVVMALYGTVSISVLAMVLVGMIAAIAFYAAVALAAGTVVPGQPAIVAIGLGILFLVPVIAGLAPVHIAPYLPTSILDWSIGLAGGQDVGWVTPVAWAIGTAAVVAFAIRRMERIEL